MISPLTDLVVKHMDANQGVSKADAEKAVSAQFAELKAEPELLFGDYLAKSSANKVAQALNIVGETLVSHQAWLKRICNSWLKMWLQGRSR